MIAPAIVLPVPDEPDAPAPAAADAPTPGAAGEFAGALTRALDDVAGKLDAAARAEAQFAGGRGGLQEMVVARAQADVSLALAAAAASRTTQALSTILGMQV